MQSILLGDHRLRKTLGVIYSLSFTAFLFWVMILLPLRWGEGHHSHFTFSGAMGGLWLPLYRIYRSFFGLPPEKAAVKSLKK
jgi:hypothetical protein